MKTVVPAVLAGLVLALWATPARADDNDDPATAPLVRVGQVEIGEVEAGQPDCTEYWAVEAETGDEIVATVTSASAPVGFYFATPDFSQVTAFPEFRGTRTFRREVLAAGRQLLAIVSADESCSNAIPYTIRVVLRHRLRLTATVSRIGRGRVGVTVSFARPGARLHLSLVGRKASIRRTVRVGLTGRARVVFRAPAGRYRLAATYAGDETTRPATRKLTLVVR